MISGVAGLIFRRERTSTPASSSSPISLISAAGESTTPLPIRHSASSRRMPDGIRCSTVFLPPITSVWPALWPPWNRTTPPMSCVSRSTILPLPSSPHWAPSTTTDWPMATTPGLKGSALPHPPQRQHARAQHDRADPAQPVVRRRQHLHHRPLPGTRCREQHQAFEHGDQAQGCPEILHASLSAV